MYKTAVYKYCKLDSLDHDTGINGNLIIVSSNIFQLLLHTTLSIYGAYLFLDMNDEHRFDLSIDRFDFGVFTMHSDPGWRVLNLQAFAALLRC